MEKEAAKTERQREEAAFFWSCLATVLFVGACILAANWLIVVAYGD